MNILVTGGSGFLGSHIVEALYQKGYNVSILDLQKPKFNITNINYISGNIVNKEDVDRAVKGNDIIYHFSGISGIEDCKNNPRRAVEINILGLLNVLESCVRYSVKRIVFASSAYVFSRYGYVYKTTKIAGENLIKDFSEIYNLKYTNIRYGSLYGRRADFRNSIYNMLYNALNNGVIIYKGTGKEYREFIHVKDAAEISANILTDQYLNKDIIITGNEKFKYEDVLKMIQEILGNKIAIKFENKKDSCHYDITPYSFNSEIGTKIVKNEYIDFGQGILDCLDELANNKIKRENDEAK